METFKITDKGDLKNFLGLEIEYDKDEDILKLNQEKYLNGVLKRFNFADCKASMDADRSQIKNKLI